MIGGNPEYLGHPQEIAVKWQIHPTLEKENPKFLGLDCKMCAVEKLIINFDEAFSYTEDLHIVKCT